ncbi:phage tail protein [Pasteurella multocida]|uniref:phage tail protein n=1 Tax=Pasteurella multocida TaxID=747 RepID=UPI0035A87618
MMTIETFKWKSQWGMTSEITRNVDVVKFGDGYEQQSSKGLNDLIQTSNVIVRLNKRVQENDINELKVFLAKHLSLYAFYWTPPGNSGNILVVCDKYSKTDNGVYIDFELTFRQVFN